MKKRKRKDAESSLLWWSVAIVAAIALYRGLGGPTMLSQESNP